MSTTSANPRKPVRLSAHAAGYRERRGFTDDEVTETIYTEQWQAARGGRMETAKDFDFNAKWNGISYATKRVRPVFVDEPEEIVVVTVYTYFF